MAKINEARKFIIFADLIQKMTILAAGKSVVSCMCCMHGAALWLRVGKWKLIIMRVIMEVFSKINGTQALKERSRNHSMSQMTLIHDSCMPSS